jgi:hypothetical protein
MGLEDGNKEVNVVNEARKKKKNKYKNFSHLFYR